MSNLIRFPDKKPKKPDPIKPTWSGILYIALGFIGGMSPVILVLIALWLSGGQ